MNHRFSVLALLLAFSLPAIAANTNSANSFTFAAFGDWPYFCG